MILNSKAFQCLFTVLILSVKGYAVSNSPKSDQVLISKTPVHPLNVIGVFTKGRCVSGVPGIPGTPGIPGRHGSQGLKGSKGDRGETGSTVPSTNWKQCAWKREDYTPHTAVIQVL